ALLPSSVQGHAVQQMGIPPEDPQMVFPIGRQSASEVHMCPTHPPAHTAPEPEYRHPPPAAKHKPSPHEPQREQELPAQLGGGVDVEVELLVVDVVVGGEPGSGGQLAGGGAFFWPRNIPGWSCAAVDGGEPDDFAGAAAHQPPPPRVSVTATTPCDGSSSE